MALRAVKPEAKEKRLKMFVYGSAGIGKTTAAIQFPSAYIIDTERGTDEYAKSINRAGSVVFQSNSFDEVFKEVKELLTTKHEFRTLIIDSITPLYQAVQDKWSVIFEKYAKSEKEAEVQDFGFRYWARVKSDFKKFQRMLIALDMNVVITAHQKDMYGGNMQKIGVTFDSMKGEDYLYDFVFRLEKKADKRMAVTVKERSEINEQRFPAEFEWSYDAFKKFYGAETIERASVPTPLATPEQVEKVKALLSVVRIEDGEVLSWWNKAGVESWEEMKSIEIEKVLAFLNKKLEALKK